MERNPVALVLGGTVPHCYLIQLLKKRGYHTVLIDYTQNPPAKEFADEHVKESTLDKEVVLRIAREKNAALVISTNVDQANVTCCYVAEQLGLPHPYSYETALDVTDKKRMKQIMWDNGIPTSRYVVVKGLDELQGVELTYPLIIKPADSNSANGVKRVESEDELIRFLPDALRFSRNSSAIVEEFKEGKEISAYGVVVNGKAKLLMHQERISVYDGVDKVIKCYASLAPSRISENAVFRAESLLTQIAQAFGLDNTPLFFQGIVQGEEISIIEFAPRVGGGISFRTILDGTGYDMISAGIDSFLGIPIETATWHSMNRHYAVNQIYGENGVYDHCEGVDNLVQDGIAQSISFYKAKGDVIDTGRASSSRIGVMVVSGSSQEELRRKIATAFSTLDTFDINGKSIIRRDLNLDSLWERAYTNS